MGARKKDRSYLREFSKSRSGLIGLGLLLILIGISVFVVVTIPSSEVNKWENPAAWTDYPAAVPPTWVNYFGVDAPPTDNLQLGAWTGSTSGGSGAFTAATTFTWDHGVTPSNFVITPTYAGTAYEMDIVWTKPDGNQVQILVSSPSSGTAYDLGTTAVSHSLVTYVQAQTNRLLSGLTQPQELAALFNVDGPGILNGTVQKGSYTLTVQLIGDSQLSPSSTKTTLLGDSYGTMGTDSVGRPIDLGVLMGLPWALELGGIASVLSVVGGILWGGLSGFYGGWRDKVMSWGTLVILAIPGLAFIIALSYSFPLTLLSEALIIAALSWPGFAIIARSVTLSIGSQAYVEADRAMGVSSTRTFFTHFLPRLTPVTIAFTALSVSGVIITGETLAFLGIEPGNVVTWGGILNDAISFDASLHGWWWWVFFPGVMIAVASIPFVLVGFALDRIVAPRVSAK